MKQQVSLYQVITFFNYSLDVPYIGRYNHGNSGNNDAAFYKLCRNGIKSDESIFCNCHFT